jgi:hypothetical protein
MRIKIFDFSLQKNHRIKVDFSKIGFLFLKNIAFGKILKKLTLFLGKIA